MATRLGARGQLVARRELPDGEAGIGPEELRLHAVAAREAGKRNRRRRLRGRDGLGHRRDLRRRHLRRSRGAGHHRYPGGRLDLGELRIQGMEATVRVASLFVELSGLAHDRKRRSAQVIHFAVRLLFALDETEARAPLGLLSWGARAELDHDPQIADGDEVAVSQRRGDDRLPVEVDRRGARGPEHRSGRARVDHCVGGKDPWTFEHEVAGSAPEPDLLGAEDARRFQLPALVDLEMDCDRHRPRPLPMPSATRRAPLRRGRDRRSCASCAEDCPR